MNRFERLGRWCARHRRPVVVAWLALVGLSVPLAIEVPGALRAGGFINADLESARAKAVLETEIGVAEAAVVVVFHSDAARAGDPGFETAAATAVADGPNAPYVPTVGPDQRS